MDNRPRTQASLGSQWERVNSDNLKFDNLIMAKVVKVYYQYQTVELQSLSGKMRVAQGLGTNGKFSAPYPKEFTGMTPENQPYGHIPVIVPGTLVLVAFVDGNPSNPIIVNSYGVNELNNKLVRTPMISGDMRDNEQYKFNSASFTLKPSLTYEYYDGEGNTIKTWNGKTLLSVSSDSNEQESSNDFMYGTLYDDLFTSRYSDNSLIEPRIQRAPNMLFKHQGVFDMYGEPDEHITMVYLGSDGTFRRSTLNKEEQFRTTVEQDNKGNYRVQYQSDSVIIDDGLDFVEFGITTQDKEFYIKNNDHSFNFTDKGILIDGKPLLANIDDNIQDAFKKLEELEESMKKVQDIIVDIGDTNLGELIDSTNKAIKDVEELTIELGKTNKRLSDSETKLSNAIIKYDKFIDDLGDYQVDTNASISSLVDSISKINNIELLNIKNTEEKYRQTTFRDIKIHADLPFKFQGYEQVVTDNNAKYYFPQGLALDDDFIYIVERAPETGRKSIIVVYDKTFKYVTKFYAGSTGGEGIHVEKEGNKRYAYIRTTSNKLGKFNVTTLNSSIDGTTLEPEVEFDINMFMNFFRTEEGWGVEANNQAKGVYLQRDTLVLYNHDFSKRLGYLWIPPSNSTLWSNDLYGSISNYSAKKQGMTLINNTIVQTMGGNWLPTRDKELHTYHMQGIQEINPNGNIMNDYTYSPTELKKYIESKGKRVFMIEHEGAFAYNNRLFSLVVYTNRAYEESSSQGILLVEYKPKEKEYTFSQKGIPFIAPTANYNPYKPNIDNKLVNEYTGEDIEDLQTLAKYMIDTFQDKVIIYTSKITGFKDFNGNTYPTGRKIVVENLNNGTFHIRDVGLHDESFAVLSYKRDEGIFQFFPRKEDSNYNSLDLLNIDKSIKGYSINTVNTPENVSTSGWFSSNTEVTAKRVTYQPYDSYDTYLNIYNDNQWQGWKKITTVE